MADVLVIDDDRVILLMMSKILESAGISILQASSAEEALELLKTEKISVLLTDMYMPGLNGLELFQKITQERPSMRAILCSAYMDYGLIADIMAVGFDDCLTKPIKKDKLLQSVQRSLGIQAHWRMRIAELRHLNQAQKKEDTSLAASSATSPAASENV